MIIPAPEWMPDQTNDGTGTADEDVILNVIPDVDSYRPWQSTALITGALGARAQGAIGVVDTMGVAYDYAGDANHLYRLVSLSWIRATNVTVSATYSYSISTDRWWEFEQWGNTTVATNGLDPVQEITMGSANFVDLAGAPPLAYHIATVRDFLWLGHIAGNPNRVQWSAINDSHSWTVDATTLADYQDLPDDGGHVQRIIGGESATIFKEHSIWRARFVGTPGIFDFGDGPIVRNIGLLAPMSAVRYGDTVFFLSEGGFYKLDAQSTQPIGQNKIDRTFFADLDSQYASRISAVVWPTEKLYIVAYPGSGNNGGIPNKLLVYNFGVNRWALINEEVEMLWRYISAGYTLEGLDPFGTLDTLPATLDAALWAGGQITLAGFSNAHRTVSFTGDAKDATVTTREFVVFGRRRAQITRVRPLVDANSASITPLTRNRMTDARVLGSAVSQNSQGDVPLRVNANYVSLRVNTTGNFTRIRGVELLDFADAGNR
jgi:hypothetical protein